MACRSPFQQEGTLMVWPWTYAGYLCRREVNSSKPTVNQLLFVPVSCLQPHVSNRGQSGKFHSSFHVKNVKSFTHSHTKISCAKFVSRENLWHSLQAMKSKSHRRRPILLWNRYVPTIRGGRGVIHMYRL